MLPTETELSILRVLWSRGPSTVREVHRILEREQTLGYTSVLKMLQIMHEKGLVTRDTSERAHVYEALVGEATIQRGLVQELVERAFGGSARKLILRALDVEEVSSEEFAQIRELLDETDRED